MKSESRVTYTFTLEELSDIMRNTIERYYGPTDYKISSITPIMKAIEPPAGVSDMGSPIYDFTGIEIVTKETKIS